MTKLYLFYPKSIGCLCCFGLSKYLERICIGQTFDYVDESQKHTIEYLEYSATDENFNSDFSKKIYVCVTQVSKPGWGHDTIDYLETGVKYSHCLEELLEYVEKNSDTDYKIYAFSYHPINKSTCLGNYYRKQIITKKETVYYFEECDAHYYYKILWMPGMTEQQYQEWCQKINTMKELQKEEQQVDEDEKLLRKSKYHELLDQNITNIFEKSKKLFKEALGLERLEDPDMFDDGKNELLELIGSTSEMMDNENLEQNLKPMKNLQQFVKELRIDD